MRVISYEEKKLFFAYNIYKIVNIIKKEGIDYVYYMQ